MEPPVRMHSFEVSSEILRGKHNPQIVRKAFALRDAGKEIAADVGRELGVNASTIQRWWNEGDAYKSGRTKDDAESTARKRERVRSLSMLFRDAVAAGKHKEASILDARISKLLGDDEPERREEIHVHRVLGSSPLEAIRNRREARKSTIGQYRSKLEKTREEGAPLLDHQEVDDQHVDDLEILPSPDTTDVD